jgi:hypothetical protein
MLFAFALVAALPDLIPARWASSDPATLDIVRATPVNCLLIEEKHWSGTFNAEAAKRGIAAFAVLRPKADTAASARRALDLQFSGAVIEGAFEPAQRSALRNQFSAAKLPAIDITLRSEMNLDGSAAVIGTYQGLWPGVQVDEGGVMKAAPSGAPWIDTNTGFLRFVRASTSSTIWMAEAPPEGKTYPAQRYLQAIGDSALVGARWVIALDAQFTSKLLARDAQAIDAWRRMGSVLEFYEAHKEWRNAEPFAHLALLEDVDSGALLSGGILDMIAVKHTPVRPVPNRALDNKSLSAARMAVNVDPAALNDQQKDTLKAFTRAGGTLLTGPPGWKFPQPRADQITLEKDDLKKLDDIWRELNSMTGRKNLGARLFNVSSMLSNLTEIPQTGTVVLNLVNYTDFPVENVTVHVLGTFKSAQLVRPGGTVSRVESYPVDEGTGFDIDKIDSVAALMLTR